MKQAWKATKARRVLAALVRIGWTESRIRGSHRLLTRPNWRSYVWGFHDIQEIGPVMLAKISKHTGLKPEDL